MTTPSRATLLAAAVLAATLSGCTTTSAPPRLALSVDPGTFVWGSNTFVSIENLGEAAAPAPVRLSFAAVNGTVVRTYADLTQGRGLPGGGRIEVGWDGSDDDGRLVLWGAYTITLDAGGTTKTAGVTITEPPTFAITVDAIPREAPAGSGRQFVINNTGNEPLRGHLVAVAGRDNTILFRGEADVELAPGQGWSFLWDGRRPEGGSVEPKVYALQARLTPSDGRSDMTATDWFRVT